MLQILKRGKSDLESVKKKEYFFLKFLIVDKTLNFFSSPKQFLPTNCPKSFLCKFTLVDINLTSNNLAKNLQ